MAWPARRSFTCPCCGQVFEADTLGDYEVRAFDADLRPLGSIEAVRKASLTSCPGCLYTNYGWDFGTQGRLDGDLSDALRGVVAATGVRARGRRGVDPLDRFVLAEACFRTRGLDPAAIAELVVTGYYVALDTGASGSVLGRWRDRAAERLEAAISGDDDDDLGAALRARYHYLAGELRRREGDSAAAREHFDAAMDAARDAAGFEGALDDDPIEGEDPSDIGGGSLGGEHADAPRGAGAATQVASPREGTLTTETVARLANRARARLRWENATLRNLSDHSQGEEPDEAQAARVLIAERRDPAALALLPEVYAEAPADDRREMLRAVAASEPPASLFRLYAEALGDDDPSIVRLAAHCAGRVGDARALDPLLDALERHGAAVVEGVCAALKRIPSVERFERVREILDRWLSRRDGEGSSAQGDMRGRASLGRVTDLLKEVLYIDDGPDAVDLMVADLEQLGGSNDLWEKPPSYSPVPFLLRRGSSVAEWLRPLLASENAVARRWSARCLGELGDREAVAGLRHALADDVQSVRLEAARALAAIGLPEEGERLVLAELADLADDFPFALHFLVPFGSPQVLAFLLDALDRGRASRAEVLPILGRQARFDRSVVARIEEGLEATSEEARGGAVTGLSFAAPQGLAARLSALYDGETDSVRRRIVYALGRLVRTGAADADVVIPRLHEALAGGGRDVAFAAAVALLELGDGAGLELARDRAEVAMAAGGDDYDLAIPALRALESFAWSDAALAVRERETPKRSTPKPRSGGPVDRARTAASHAKSERTPKTKKKTAKKKKAAPKKTKATAKKKKTTAKKKRSVAKKKKATAKKKRVAPKKKTAPKKRKTAAKKKSRARR